MNFRRLLRTTSFTASIVLIAGLSGCASGPAPKSTQALADPEAALVAKKSEYLQPRYKKLYQEGRRNEVLNRMEIGTAAFYQGDIDEARENFDVVLGYIETVYADNPEAHKARSRWHEEGRKDFKGEPYERSMAYYYRGLIYLIDGEYGNARASFESGLMQDAFAEEEQNRSDLAIMMFLAGWSAQKMGSSHLAEEAFQELRKLHPNFPIPAPDHNVLVIGETGKAPRKLADGLGHYELVFRPGKKFTEKLLDITAAGESLNVRPIENVYFQATSRGGRPVDAFIEGKAKFRNTHASMGQTLAEIGVAANLYAPVGGSSLGDVGSGLALIGVAQMALAANVKPRADTRYWSNLPDILHITTLRSEDNDGSLVIDDWQAAYQDQQGETVPLTTGVFRQYADKKGNYIVWHSSRPRI